jgi:hypothetical protein
VFQVPVGDGFVVGQHIGEEVVKIIGQEGLQVGSGQSGNDFVDLPGLFSQQVDEAVIGLIGFSIVHRKSPPWRELVQHPAHDFRGFPGCFSFLLGQSLRFFQGLLSLGQLFVADLQATGCGPACFWRHRCCTFPGWPAPGQWPWQTPYIGIAAGSAAHIPDSS